MTQNRELKRRIRLRMRMTGEGYMQSRAALVSAARTSRPTPHDDRSNSEMTVPPPALAWTPRAQVLLRKAESWAIQMRHDYVGTEHLLLAITDDDDGIAGHALTETQSRQSVREYLLRTVASVGYYTTSVMELDDQGNPAIDEATGQLRQRSVPPSP